MKKVIVTHATKSQEEIVEMNWQERFQNPVPYHHIMNRDGTIRKGKADREVCGHCGRWPGNSHSEAYTRGVTAKSGIFRKRECPEIGFCSFFVYGEFYKFTVKGNKKTSKLFGVFEVCFGILLFVSRSHSPLCSFLPHSNLLKTNFKNTQNEFIELTL